MQRMTKTTACVAHTITHAQTYRAAHSATLFSPAARHWAHRLGLMGALSGRDGSGLHGMLTKADVLALHSSLQADPAALTRAVAAAPAAAPATAAAVTGPAVSSVEASMKAAVNDRYTDVPLTTMRKVIARRLAESKSTVPHSYSSIAVSLTSVMALRESLKAKYGVSVSVNDCVIKAAALALKDSPNINSRFDPAANKVVPAPNVDISVAVATPSGLITPIVFNADARGLTNISSTVRDLATRAKDNKLKPEEFQGGTFSISNLGMFGVSEFTAVINPPQSCILAVGAGISRVVPGKTEPKSETFVTLQLSHDRRVVDEAAAGQFLQLLQKYLADTDAMLL